MAEPEVAAASLLILVALLAVFGSALIFALLLRAPRPRLATPTPMPLPEERFERAIARNMTPSALARAPAHWQAMARERLPSAPAAILQVHTGPLQGSRFPVGRPMLALGRSRLCDISLPDPRASRQHARIEWRADGLYLVDTNSTNGTCVNGQRVIQTRLRGGERVLIGDTLLTIQLY